MGWWVVQVEDSEDCRRLGRAAFCGTGPVSDAAAGCSLEYTRRRYVLAAEEVGWERWESCQTCLTGLGIRLEAS